MSEHAFFAAGDRILHIANAGGAGPQYRAAARVLPPGVASPTRCEDSAETTIVVISGAVELMVNGATGHLGAGEFARVPPRVAFAYRNAGQLPAELLVRTAPAATPRPTSRVTIDIAAA